MLTPTTTPAHTAPSPHEMPGLSDADIHERIVSAILDHRLLPGTKLVEDKLGQAFGVSRTRIRHVLIRLANEQLVTLTPHRGASVARPSVDEAREVFEVRRMIEPTLLARFMRVATPADLRNLALYIDQEEDARARGDRSRAIRLSGDFHLLIGARSGHRTLDRVLREMVSRTSLVLMSYGTPEATGTVHPTRGGACGCHEHRGLLAAIRLGDERAAGELMQRHLSHLEALLDFTLAERGPVDLLSLFGS